MIYALTGKYPIELPSNPMTGDLDWVSEVPDLSPRLKLVLDKAIKMDLSQRYLTAEAMYKDLH